MDREVGSAEATVDLTLLGISCLDSSLALLPGCHEMNSQLSSASAFPCGGSVLLKTSEQ